MVDKSWGVPGASDLRVRTNRSPAERADDRARARDARIATRDDGLAARLEARAAQREAEKVAREAARTARREEEQRLAASDPHKAALQRRRGSGRKDIVREDRDTTGYAMVVDAQRIRTLAARGASVESLAAVFNMPVAEIERALAGSQ